MLTSFAPFSEPLAVTGASWLGSAWLKVGSGGIQAQRPVLYVGGGCVDAAEEVREFVRRTGIPVVQTLMGLGTFPESDPLALQVCTQSFPLFRFLGNCLLFFLCHLGAGGFKNLVAFHNEGKAGCF